MEREIQAEVTTAIVPMTIKDIDTQEVKNTLQKVKTFQTIVRQNLTPKHDYGLIPGCGNKPSLFKPGAEKICILFGLYPQYTVSKIEDYEKGFFAYDFTCSLFDKLNQKVSEGVGTANTKEKKYAKQDAFSISNTILKMAKKRAYIDAVLQVASLSEVFTQDLEDLKDNGAMGLGAPTAKTLGAEYITRIDACDNLTTLTAVCGDITRALGQDYKKTVLAEYSRRKKELEEGSAQ